MPPCIRHQNVLRRPATAALEADGFHEETGCAEPSEVLRLGEPFPTTLDAAALVR